VIDNLLGKLEYVSLRQLVYAIHESTPSEMAPVETPATGDRPAIEKILVDMTKTVRTAQPQSTATWKIALEFTDWVFDGALPDSVFSMEIPPSTIRIPYTELVPAPQDQPGPVAP